MRSWCTSRLLLGGDGVGCLDGRCMAIVRNASIDCSGRDGVGDYGDKRFEVLPVLIIKTPYWAVCIVFRMQFGNAFVRGALFDIHFKDDLKQPSKDLDFQYARPNITFANGLDVGLPWETCVMKGPCPVRLAVPY